MVYMKIHFTIFFIFLFGTQAVSAQPVVVDASSLGQVPGLNYLPDVEGKVLIDQNLRSYIKTFLLEDTVSVYPSWPVSSPGQNERGGVFGNLDDDPELELIYPVGAALYAFNIDASAVDGWPRTLDDPTDGAASFGDIDGDGIGEIVVTTHEIGTFASGKIYAFEVDGTNVSGFPVTTEGGSVRTPVLADLDGDGALEIIVAIRNWPEGFISVYRGNGTVYPNWPQRMDYVPAAAVAVGDINGDEIPEIIAESYYRLHAYRPDGSLLPGFPYLPGADRVFSYSSPVLADLDEDGNREIICGDHSITDGSGAVHIVRYDGTSWQGWPKITGSWIYGPPSVGDINDDGFLDIAVGDQMLSVTPANKIYAWTAITGDALPGFPILNVFGVNSQIILADLDGDGKIELMADDNTATGKYPGYNHDGTIMGNWPLKVNGSTFFVNPLVVDIGLDGTMAIAGGGYDQESGNTNVYLWNANVEYNAELAVLPILQYNTRHNGVYGDYLMVGTPEVPQQIKGGWKIFPNPASVSLTLCLPDFSVYSSPPEDIQVGIFSSSGMKIYDHKYMHNGREIHIDLAGYPSGIYWIAAGSNNKKKEMMKFIIISH
jgi:hypothetical protein